MVLNPKGIEPTFLKLDSWSPGAGFIPIITSNTLNYIKKKRIQEKKTVLCIQKTFNAVIKNWFNLVLGIFHAYRTKMNLDADHLNIDMLSNTADTDLLKMVPIKILLNFGNYVICTLLLGF